MNWQDAFDNAQRTKTANVVCMKWGELYGPEWVNKLYGMVSRNTSWNVRFVCLTDDAKGIRPEVECLSFPPLEIDPAVARKHRGNEDPWWRKLCLYSEAIHDLEGLTLYLDLDVVIADNMDVFFEYPGRFCMMRVWRSERFDTPLGNSSVVRLVLGAESYIVERFRSQPHAYWDEVYHGHDQAFVSATAKEITFFPEDWCVSFKDTLPRNALLRFLSSPKLPARARIIVFFGVNTPPAALKGEIDPTKSPNPKRRRARFKRRFRPARWLVPLWAE
jgi:hypothetical protein